MYVNENLVYFIKLNLHIQSQIYEYIMECEKKLNINEQNKTEYFKELPRYGNNIV